MTHHDLVVRRAGAPVPLRAARAVLAATLLLACGLLMGAPGAQGEVVTIGEQTLGLQPHATDLTTTSTGIFSANPLPVLSYGGGPVVHANATYAIYWDPAQLRPGDPGRPGKYHGDWQQLVNQFMSGVATDSGSFANVFALTPQYPETGGARPMYSSTFRGPYVDHDTYPADGCTDPAPLLNDNFACFTDAQLRTELAGFIAANGLHAGLGTIFYLLTPPGVTVCADAGTIAGHCSDSALANPWAAEPPSPTAEEVEDRESYANSFCSYHGDFMTPSNETALYAVIPWSAGTFGSDLLPKNRNGSDCQDGTGLLQEPNQSSLSLDGFYDHGLPDVLINQIAIEQLATITDPLLNGWTEPLSGDEVPDECRNWFELPPVVAGSGTPDEHTGAGSLSNQTIAGHVYYLNTELNQAADYREYPGLRCELHNNLIPSFTPPTPVNAGDVVGFDGGESDVTLDQSAQATPAAQPLYRASFAWDFGDGTKVSGPGYSAESPSSPLYASVFHAYTYGGQYDVTLTITDAGGATASVTHTVTVVGPPPPGSATNPGGSGAATGAAAGSGSGSGSGAQPGAPLVPGPVARAAALSHSLGQALRRGLPVSYSVNEQVAGQFEVLLDRRTAQRLKIGGPTAGGLPAGAAPALVIGRALVVTTKGGRSVLRIKFSRSAVARLRGVHRLTVTLRLIVRNAASQSPTSTTVLSSIVLHR